MSLTSFLRHCLTNLLNEFNGRKQVKSKVDEVPLNALTFVLLLLQNEHVVVKELLKLLVCQVNAQLLKGVELEKRAIQNARNEHLNNYEVLDYDIKLILLKLFH